MLFRYRGAYRLEAPGLGYNRFAGGFSGDGGVAIEMTGGVIVAERGTVVTFRQKCEECGYVFDWNKTTIVPAFSSRKVRPFTCPECGNYQEVEARYLHKGPRQTPT
jgi:hypothetical protein